jgi:hypothetical protein
MALLVQARAEAIRHWWRYVFWRRERGHRIWRYSRGWGFDTRAVVCECGAEFGHAANFTSAEEEYLQCWRADLRSVRKLHTRLLIRREKP